jgi:hypothetical protein
MAAEEASTGCEGSVDPEMKRGDVVFFFPHARPPLPRGLAGGRPMDMRVGSTAAAATCEAS